MKKVLLICDFEQGGGAEKVYSVTTEVLSDTYDVLTYTGSKDHSFSKNVIEYLFSRKHKSALTQLLNEQRPEICHLHIYSHILSPSILLALKKYKRKNRNAQIIYTAHDYHLIYPNSTLLHYKKGNPVIASYKASRFQNLVERVDSRGVAYSWLKKLQWHFHYSLLKSHLIFDKIICPSEFNADMLRDKKYCNDVQVVRNPIDTRKAIHTQPPVDPIKLIFFGRLSSEKGVLDFIQLINQAPVDYTLDIYGKGDQENEIVDAIAKFGLEDRICMKGYIPHHEMMYQLKKYHAMVIPSVWYEVAPLSIIEASMNGLRVIGTNIGGIRELAELTGNQEYLFELGNRQSLHSSLQKLRLDIQSKHQPEVNKNLDVFTPEYYRASIIKCYEGN